MSYIELHQSVFAHRKTMRAAARLNVSRAVVVGHLSSTWTWGLDNAKPDGDLGDITVEEVAMAADWPINRADEFVSVMVEVGYLDQTTQGFALHNWEKYTGRYYAMKTGRNTAKNEGGAYGNHQRWHVKGGKFDPSCPWCSHTDSDSDSHTDSDSDSHTESDASVSLTPPLSDLAKRSSESLATKPRGARESPLNLTDIEWRQVADAFPGENLQSFWREWTSWIEEEEKRGRSRAPDNKVEAFKGFVRKKIAGRAQSARASA